MPPAKLGNGQEASGDHSRNHGPSFTLITERDAQVQTVQPTSKPSTLSSVMRSCYRRCGD